MENEAEEFEIIPVQDISHSRVHLDGTGTCTCGVGPYCPCGFCFNCGRYEFAFRVRKVKKK